MKKLLVLSALLLFPLHAAGQIRGALRGGAFAGSGHDLVGTAELDARVGAWSFAPAFDAIRAGYHSHALHVDVRRLFQSAGHTMWIGAGPTFVTAGDLGSKTTWNADAGFEWRRAGRWEPFVAGRYYSFHVPVFRDSVDERGVVISLGVSWRFR